MAYRIHAIHGCSFRDVQWEADLGVCDGWTNQIGTESRTREPSRLLFNTSSSSSPSRCGSRLSTTTPHPPTGVVFPEEGEQRECGAPGGEGGWNARRQGCLKRRSSLGTWNFPRYLPPRAPLAPCFHPPETLRWFWECPGRGTGASVLPENLRRSRGSGTQNSGGTSPAARCESATPAIVSVP